LTCSDPSPSLHLRNKNTIIMKKNLCMMLPNIILCIKIRTGNTYPNSLVVFCDTIPVCCLFVVLYTTSATSYNEPKWNTPLKNPGTATDNWKKVLPWQHSKQCWNKLLFTKNVIFLLYYFKNNSNSLPGWVVIVFVFRCHSRRRGMVQNKFVYKTQREKINKNGLHKMNI